MLDGYVWIGVDIISHKASGWMINDGKRDWMAKEAMQGTGVIEHCQSLQHFYRAIVSLRHLGSYYRHPLG